MFAADFGDEINRYANLVDPKGNQFEVLVERINNNVFLTHGWSTIRDFYGIRIGAWVLMLYTMRGQLLLDISYYRIIYC
jgi:hypothetical protein